MADVDGFRQTNLPARTFDHVGQTTIVRNEAVGKPERSLVSGRRNPGLSPGSVVNIAGTVFAWTLLPVWQGRSRITMNTNEDRVSLASQSPCRSDTPTPSFQRYQFMQPTQLNHNLHSLTLLALFAGSIFAAPLGTTFTYQGQLNTGGTPANGSYDRKFTLFDSSGGRIGVDGRVSAGGVFSVSGIVGQPDAGPAGGGGFTIKGGIVAAVQTPGAPYLTVLRTTTNTVCVSWPLPNTGWKLQATANLVSAGPGWVDLLPPYQTNATNLYFIEPSPAGNKFYPLTK
jgi:hypothetical protein